MKQAIFVLIVTGLLFAALAGCGSSNTQTSSNTPSPGTPSPTPTPTPTPTPSAISFKVSLTGFNRPAAMPSGELDVNPDGSAHISFGGAPNAVYNVTFCPYPSGVSANCQQVGTVTADNLGLVNSDFHYSQAGTFVGSFAIDQNGSVALISAWNTGQSGAKFQSGIFRAGAVTSGGGAWTSGSDPLSSGTVMFSDTGNNGGSLNIVLQGAAPNTTYGISGCPNGTRECLGLGSVTTDSQGNANVLIVATAQSSPIDVITFNGEGQNGNVVEFATALHVQ